MRRQHFSIGTEASTACYDTRGCASITEAYGRRR